MQKIIWITGLVLWLPAASLLAQASKQVVDTENDASLDAQQEKRALQSLMKIVEREIISTVDAMPADKFGFAPIDGDLRACVRLVKW